MERAEDRAPRQLWVSSLGGDDRVNDALLVLYTHRPKPPKFLVLLEVKLLNAFESRTWFKQGGKL